MQMNILCRCFVYLFLYIISVFIDVTSAKKFDGYLDSSSDWSFIARFCFLSTNGDMSYTISYPLNFYPDGTEIGYDLLLYYDEKWSEVYSGYEYRNCSKKVGILHRELNQIITLTSRDAGSGCKLLIQSPNGTFVQEVMPWEQLFPDSSVQRSWLCEGTRTFSTIRDRWWYFAIASCGNPAGLSHVRFNFKFRNDKNDAMKKEFSADEFGILETCIVFIILIQILVGCAVYVARELSELNFLHVTFKMLFWAIVFWDLSIVFLLAYYANISVSGYEVRGVADASYVFNAISTIIFISLLLLLGKGYTVTHGRLAGVVQVVIATIVILLSFLYAVLFFYEIAVFDPAAVLYLYQSPGGYGICAVRICVWVYFAYACFRTIHHHKTKSEFYYTFFSVYTVWFFAFPIFVFLGTFVLEKWVRLKIVTIIEMSITFLAYCIILALMWPTHTNRFFPFHVRVTQIGTIEDPDEQSEDDMQGNTGSSINGGDGNPDIARPRIPLGYRAPSNWNIFNGTVSDTSVKMQQVRRNPTAISGNNNLLSQQVITATDSSGQLPSARATTYALFTANQANNNGTAQASTVLSPRFSEVYGSDQV